MKGNFRYLLALLPGMVAVAICSGALTNSTPSPALGEFPTPDVVLKKAASSTNTFEQYQTALDLGRQQRQQKSFDQARDTLTGVIQSDAPTEFKRVALFELALVAQDDGKLVRAVQIFAQYLQVYEGDASTPEVLLRQGLLYRQMGVNTLAISKFYAVMSTALKLKLDSMDYYKKIVLQSQIEIADTYYQEGNYDEAADFFQRLVKTTDAEMDQTEIHYKLVRSLSYSTNYSDTVSQAQIFLNLYTNAAEVPEVRFCLASALKKLGRNNDSMKQVLALLQAESAKANKDPDVWAYWQQRAGHEIATQFYKEGDYFSALQIYLSLADLDKSASWQVPIWYQTGLVYEQLQQWPKAGDVYQRILDRKNELNETNSTPTLQSIIDMAKWRKDYIAWIQKAKVTQQAFVLNKFTNSPDTSVTNTP